MVSTYNDAQDTLRLRVRTRDLLGQWTWLIDGDTGKPVELSITESFLAGRSDPQEAINTLTSHMQRIADRASILET